MDYVRVLMATREGRYYAIKFANQSQAYSPQLLEQIFQRESSILEQLSHNNIIQLVEAVPQGTYTEQDRTCKVAGLVF